MKPFDESFVIAKPRRRWLKRVGCGLLTLLILSLFLLTLAFGGWAWRHHSVQQRLDEALAELDRTDPGWRLEDIEAAREQIPEQENSARVIVAAVQLLPKDWPPKDFGDRFSHLSPEEQLDPADFARLNQELDSVRAVLDVAHKLAKMPRGRHRIAYQRNVLNTILNDQQHSRQVEHLLLCDALQCEQRQDMKDALISCRAALNAARSLGDEPLTISQLVRIRGVILTCQGLERLLAQGEPSADDLKGMQELLADEENYLALPMVARGERGMIHELFAAMERGDVSIVEQAGGRTDSWNERLFGVVYRDNVRAQHPTMLVLMSRWIAITQLPISEQSEAERQFDRDTIRELRARPAAGLAVLPLLAMPKMGDSSRRKHALLRCTIAALAIERYRQTHKKWPDSFDELCPLFLTVVPFDPFDGEPLRYRRVEDGVIIYSVSSDEIDNNGNLDREHPTQPGVDIGVRLWDVNMRRQLPKPRNEEQPPVNHHGNRE